MNSVTLLAPAKINLFLEVNGKRDDGYHNISTIMQTIRMFDCVSAKKAEIFSLNCNLKELENDNNLALKAARLFSEYFGTAGAQIRLEKKIPVGAGLGGGSADAAAVLFAMLSLYGVSADDRELEFLALRLGADVPFFLVGGTQYAQGVGELLTPLPSPRRERLLIVEGKEKVSTPAAYAKIGSLSYEAKPAAPFISSLYGKSFVPFNRFEDICDRDERYAVLEKNGFGRICLSGSGSSVFTFADGDTKKAATELTALGYTTYLTETLNSR